jgi:hypothetical protein
MDSDVSFFNLFVAMATLAITKFSLKQPIEIAYCFL